MFRKPINKPLKNPMLYAVKNTIEKLEPKEKEKKKYKFFQKNIK